MNLSADSYDFGTISQSEVVTQVFTVRNDGDAGLVIKDVRVRERVISELLDVFDATAKL
ncbi:MAG: DUF1573 domain-containing protein [Anaerolineae bacterium]